MALSDNNPYKKAAEASVSTYDPTSAYGRATNGINPFAVQAQKWEADEKARQDAEKLKAPPTDPRYQQLQQGQIDYAKAFRNSIPQLADTFMGQVAEVNKKNLATEIDQTQKSYNRRGLLNSTARLGAEANDRERSASDLAQKRYDVNTQLNQQADQLDQNAINTGFGIASQGQQVAGTNSELQNQYLDMALKRQQQQFGSMNSAFNGAGSALGYIAGNKSNGTGDYQPGPGFQNLATTTMPASNFSGYQS